MAFYFRPCYEIVKCWNIFHNSRGEGVQFCFNMYSIKIIICFKIQMIFLDDGHSPERVCAITGSPDKVQIAAHMIQHLLIEYNASDIYMFI